MQAALFTTRTTCASLNALVPSGCAQTASPQVSWRTTTACQAHVTGSDNLLAGAKIKIACIRCNDGNPAAMPEWLVKRVTE